MEISSKAFAVYLKTPEPADAEAIAKMANDKGIAQNLQAGFPHPYKRDDAVKFIDFAIDSVLKKFAYHMCVRLAENDEMVGMVGLGEISQGNERGDVGYWLGKEHRGKGYAKSAVIMMLNFAFYTLKLNKIDAKVYTYNERSLRLLERIGFQREGMLRQDAKVFGKYVDVIMLGMTKSEFQNKVKLEVKEIR